MIRKSFEITKTAAEGRTLTFTASTGEIDRDGDQLEPGGWLLDNYRRNPTVIYGHDYSSLPIAKTTKIDVSKGSLVAEMTFPPEGTYDRADIIFKLAKLGFINSCSVGFLPVESRPSGKGKIYQKMELLEISLTAVPSNPGALQQLAAKGVITAAQAAKLQPKGVDLKEKYELPGNVYIPAVPYKPLNRQQDLEIELDLGSGIKSTLRDGEAAAFIGKEIAAEIKRQRGLR